jgi:DNA-binding MarR family transcriptional regulator
MLGYLTMNDDNALQELASGFREALRHSVYLVRRLDADGELSAAQLSTLKMLLHEGQRVGEIARTLGVRVPSATEQIIKLERAGLARREPDPNDSRAVRVILTPEGRDAVDSANRRRNQVMAGILSTLSDQDRKALADALPVIDKINASLQN